MVEIFLLRLTKLWIWIFQNFVLDSSDSFSFCVSISFSKSSLDPLSTLNILFLPRGVLDLWSIVGCIKLKVLLPVIFVVRCPISFEQFWDYLILLLSQYFSQVLFWFFPLLLSRCHFLSDLFHLFEHCYDPGSGGRSRRYLWFDVK